MIEVYGTSGAAGSAEQDAANALRQMIAREWPAAETNAYDIRIVPRIKCFGERRQDVDILLLADLGTGLPFAPLHSFRSPIDEALEKPDRVLVRSLCLAIEVKDHRPKDVFFEGNKAFVRYEGVGGDPARETWEDATEQNLEQVYAVRGFLERQRPPLGPPFVTPVLWMRQVPNDELPRIDHALLGSQTTWTLLLSVVARQARPRPTPQGWVMDAFGRNASPPRKVFEVFTRKLQPTELDRKRMDRIGKMAADRQPLIDAVGDRLLILRGAAGTGKTVLLLQLAKRLCDERSARVLILTYNAALAGDLRRLLTLMGYSDDLTTNTIQVATVYDHFHRIFTRLGLSPGTGPAYWEQYERLKQEALEYLRSGAAQREDLGRLPWDYVFVDEGQDWYQNERDLLLEVQRHQEVAVADGRYQLVRRARRADWRGDLALAQVHTAHLDVCLRMKSRLVAFANAFARALNVPEAEVVPHQELVGGRVIVLDGPYLADAHLHKQLLAENIAAGNRAVDMLFCVPPSLVRALPDGEKRSAAAEVFEEWGHLVWDGVSPRVRRTYPLDENEIRVVQYASCRGLEGWITVCLCLDDLYEYRCHQYTPDEEDPGETPDDPAVAERDAAQWTLIPITRAMDTLVIQIHKPHSVVRTALEDVRRGYPDLIDWRTAP